MVAQLHSSRLDEGRKCRYYDNRGIAKKNFEYNLIMNKFNIYDGFVQHLSNYFFF